MARRSAPSPRRWVAKLWRSACGETRGVPDGELAAASSRRTARGPSRRPRALRNSAWRSAAGVRRQSIDAPLEIGVGGLLRLGPDRHDPVLASFALPHTHHCARPVGLHIADVEVAGLRDAQPGAVDHLEQRQFEGAPAGVGVRRRRRAAVEQTAHVLLAEEGRQPLGPLGSAQRRDRARLAETTAHGQTKERAQRGELATDRHGVVLPWSDAR